jgi:signal transduction histidine kinase
VSDTGPGLTAEQRTQLFVPGFTTKPQGSGLGLAIVQRIVSDHHGTIVVDDANGGGTTFRVRLPL